MPTRPFGEVCALCPSRGESRGESCWAAWRGFPQLSGPFLSPRTWPRWWEEPSCSLPWASCSHSCRRRKGEALFTGATLGRVTNGRSICIAVIKGPRLRRAPWTILLKPGTGLGLAVSALAVLIYLARSLTSPAGLSGRLRVGIIVLTASWVTLTWAGKPPDFLHEAPLASSGDFFCKACLIFTWLRAFYV